MTPRGFATTHASTLAGGNLQKVGGDLVKDPVCLFRTVQIHTNLIEPLSTKRSYIDVSYLKVIFLLGENHNRKLLKSPNSAMIFSGEKKNSRWFGLPETCG